MEYEISINGSWVSVTHDIFRSWTGKRKIDGQELHADFVYKYLTDEKTYSNARECKCKVCSK